ncbi:hypothetical protein NC651_025756 [Populus alba x Populus x berolinensis]|nr:hypothetical protein NC651_025756 [Populus alba x Populus x berolinensis]
MTLPSSRDKRGQKPSNQLKQNEEAGRTEREQAKQDRSKNKWSVKSERRQPREPQFGAKDNEGVVLMKSEDPKSLQLSEETKREKPGLAWGGSPCLSTLATIPDSAMLLFKLLRRLLGLTYEFPPRSQGKTKYTQWGSDWKGQANRSAWWWISRNLYTRKFWQFLLPISNEFMFIISTFVLIFTWCSTT